MKVFTARIHHDPNNGGAWVEIPFDVKTEFGSMRPRVKARFDDKIDYRGSLVRMGAERHVLGIRKDIRQALGKNSGDDVKVEIMADTEPREVEVPEILARALGRNSEASKYFYTLSYSNQREYVNYITEAKKPETRKKRVQKVLGMLDQTRKE